MEKVMMKKGSFSYRSVDFSKSNPFNQNKIIELQNRLRLLIRVISKGLEKIYRNFHHSGSGISYDSTVYLFWKSVVKWYQKKGWRMLNELISELKKREIHYQDYLVLKDILDIQEEIALSMVQGLSDDHVDEDQVESLLHYLKELPFYLRYDLQLESLALKKVEPIHYQDYQASLSFSTASRFDDIHYQINLKPRWG